MRIDSAVSLLSLLVALAATPAISQEATASGSRIPHPVITNISVTEGADGIDVEVTFSQLVQAEVNTLEHPDRLVFDFPGCELSHPGQRLAVNRGSVLAVRAAAFSAAPPIARVVIDLRSAQEHEETYAGNKLTIKLRTKGNVQPMVPASGGNNPAPNNQPSPPKSARADRPAPKSSEGTPPKPIVQPHRWLRARQPSSLTPTPCSTKPDP